MKNAFASFLLLASLLPCEIISFSALSTTAAVNRWGYTQSNLILKAADDSQSGVGLLEKSEASNSMESPTKTKVMETGDVAMEKEETELTETQKLLKKVKQAGTAGAISYALWELGFWGVSIPVCVVGYKELTGHWPDFTNAEDMQKVGAEAFAFVNFARLAVPLRIGLALSTTPWIEENVVKKIRKEGNSEE